MQDIIFYVAANETLGKVRDYTNQLSKAAPTLVLGVSVRLRMRLFAEPELAEPYPMDAFSGIVSWNWSMDGGYSHGTTCKLKADAGAIEAQSVTDTINGETVTFTEVVIPISNMNTEELNTWLGDAESKSGFEGELVGYDGLGKAVFILQIENFTVRNRITGTGTPTVQNQQFVTRDEAQSMIMYAISSGGVTINASNVTSAVSASYAASAGSMSGATENTYGTVRISSAVVSSTSGSDVFVPTVNAMIDYLNVYVSSGGLTTSNYVGSSIQSALDTFASSMGISSGGSFGLAWEEIS